jgi:hypothetical protein
MKLTCCPLHADYEVSIGEYHIIHMLHRIEKNMATQADIDTLTATLTEVDTEVEALVAANQAAGSPLDLTALQSVVGKLATDAAPVVTPVTPVDPSQPPADGGDTSAPVDQTPAQ